MSPFPPSLLERWWGLQVSLRGGRGKSPRGLGGCGQVAGCLGFGLQEVTPGEKAGRKWESLLGVRGRRLVLSTVKAGPGAVGTCRAGRSGNK